MYEKDNGPQTSDHTFFCIQLGLSCLLVVRHLWSVVFLSVVRHLWSLVFLSVVRRLWSVVSGPWSMVSPSVGRSGGAVVFGLSHDLFL